jgi:hypothetical protein
VHGGQRARGSAGSPTLLRPGPLLLLCGAPPTNHLLWREGLRREGLLRVLLPLRAAGRSACPAGAALRCRQRHWSMMSAAEQAAAGSGKKKKRKRGKKQRAGLPADVKKFSRGGDFPTKRIADQKLRTQMGRQEYLAQEAAVHAARSEILQPHDAGHLEADGMERTFKFTQEKIAEAVDATSARKIYDLSLQQGPYHCRYARNGRHLLIGGQKGHVAQIDWHSGKVKAEIQLRETVRDVCFLHNESLFAVAQKKYVYVYDQKGIEIHCLRHHRDAHRCVAWCRNAWLGAGWRTPCAHAPPPTLCSGKSCRPGNPPPSACWAAQYSHASHVCVCVGRA